MSISAAGNLIPEVANDDSVTGKTSRSETFLNPKRSIW
jgi:hypothetical protein